MESDNKHIELLTHALNKVYGSPGQILKRGFLLGLASGVGGILGAALIILLLGYLVSKLGWVPVIGEILQKFNSAVPN